MNIFLAGIIQGSIAEPRIHSQDWREPIKQAIVRHVPGAEVYCHYTQHPNSIAYGLDEIKATLADGLARAGACDVLVAYVPSASMGTAIEIYQAARGGAVVLTISPMTANWVLRGYSDRLFTTVEEFEAFLAASGLTELLAGRGRKAGKPL